MRFLLFLTSQRNGASQPSDPPLDRHQQLLAGVLQAARRLRTSANPPAETMTADAVDDPRIVRGEQILATLRAARSGVESPPVTTTSPIETAELAVIPRGRPAVLRMLGLTPVDQQQQ